MDRWKRLAPLSGVLLVALFVIAFALPSTPDTTASGAKVITWYRHHHDQVYTMAIIVIYAGALGALYFASVGGYLRDHGSRLLATTTTVGGAVFATGAMLGAGTLVAVNDGPQHFTPDMARTLNILQNDLFWPVLIAGYTIATLSMGVAMLRTRSLPLALGIVTTVVGVVGISGALSWFAFLAGAPLTLVIAGYVYARSGERPTGEDRQITLPDVPGQRTTAAAEPTTTTTP